MSKMQRSYSEDEVLKYFNTRQSQWIRELREAIESKCGEAVSGGWRYWQEKENNPSTEFDAGYSRCYDDILTLPELQEEVGGDE